jgi:methanogenic corrinoid protein MtbC1
VSQEILIERLFDALTSGDRTASRTIVAETLSQGSSPEQIITDLFWPTYQQISTFHRNDQLTTLSHHLATRLLRVLVDQTSAKLEQRSTVDRSIFAVCGPTDADELGAQMATDLLEATGFNMQFAGGGVAMDEILAKVQEQKPEHLLIFASSPTDLPEIRSLIDRLNEIGVCSPLEGRLQVVVGGGVFNRADGLAEEIGADLWASSPAELVDVMVNDPDRRAGEDQRTVGRHKNKKKRAAA